MRTACRTVVPAVICVWLTSCAVGPNFHRPAAPAVEGYTAEALPAATATAATRGGEAQRFVKDLDIPAQWWTLFHSAALNALIEEAIGANPNLKAGQAALRQAMENLYAQRGSYYPTVQAGFAASRQRNPTGTLAPTLNSGQPVFNLFTPQVTVSYVLDVFGGQRRQVESLGALAESQRFELEATYLTLTSNVAAAAVQEASLRAQLDATRQIVSIDRDELGILRREYDAGAIAMTDVLGQEAALAAAEATLAPLQKQLAQQRDSLAVLVGRFPSDPPPQTFELANLTLPQDLPLSIPSKLVEHRPDVRAAEAQMHAASAQVGVAIADLLPQFNLNGSAGSTATALSQLGKSGNGFWSLGASLTQSIFAGGSLVHHKRAADAALDQAGEEYRAAVLTAFQDVADSLHALAADAAALDAQARAEHAAADNLEAVRRNVDLGSIGSLNLLNAEQTYQQSVLNLVQAEANRYSDTVALFQSLGGGWWNR